MKETCHGLTCNNNINHCYLYVALQDDTHASELQPSGFQAQRCNVSAFHIQDSILQQVFPYQEQHHSL